MASGGPRGSQVRRSQSTTGSSGRSTRASTRVREHLADVVGEPGEPDRVE